MYVFVITAVSSNDTGVVGVAATFHHAQDVALCGYLMALERENKRAEHFGNPAEEAHELRWHYDMDLRQWDAWGLPHWAYHIKSYLVNDETAWSVSEYTF